MAYALVAHVAASSTNGSGFTTAAVDTTGATLLLMSIAKGSSGGNGFPSDSKGNTWLTIRQVAQAGGDPVLDLWYVRSPTVGSGHTFTVGTGASTFPSVTVAAFSGTDPVAASDQVNSVNAGSGTILTGSVTPSEDNELVVAVLTGIGTAAASIGSGFTITDDRPFVAGLAYANAMAYGVQTTAAATNPLWTRTGDTLLAAAIVTFKSTPVPGGGAGAFPITGIVDTTTRANENPLSNSGYWGGPDTVNVQLVSNRIAAVSNTTFKAFSIPTYAANAEVYLTVDVLPAANDSLYLFLRLATNYYYCELFTSNGSNSFGGGRFVQSVAGVETIFATTPGPVTVAPGSQVGFRTFGTTLTGYVNGTAFLTTTNQAVTPGGTLGFIGHDTAIRLSTVGGGTVAAANPFPRYGIVDNCTRANENPLSNGGVWAAAPPLAGALQLVSNRITNTLAAISAQALAATPTSADQELRVRLAATTVPVSTAALNLYLRFTAATSWYTAQWSRAASGTTDWLVQLYKATGGTETPLGSAVALTVVPGDELGLDVVGTTLTAYRNGAVTTSLTDSAVSTVGGLVLLFISNTIEVDRVGAGPLGAVPPSTRLPVRLHHYATQRS